MASHDWHLTGEERRKIAKWREGKLPVPEIAYQLSRAPSTIYRELKPITDWDADLPQHGGCDAVTAQDKHERRRAAYRKLVAHPQPRLLSRKHSRRVGLRNRLLDGHGLNSTAFASASPGRRPCPPRHASRSRLAAAPSSRHGDGWRRVGSRCELVLRSAAPWQKGTVENTNGRLRKPFPARSPTALTNRHPRSICQRLNSTLRMCLGYGTPAKVFERNRVVLRNRLDKRKTENCAWAGVSTGWRTQGLRSEHVLCRANCFWCTIDTRKG